MERYVFGVDVGGTTVKLGLFRADGSRIRKWEIPTRTENHGDGVLADIREALLSEMRERKILPEQILGAGVGLPGPVTPDGVVNRCVNLGWGRRDVPAELSALLDGIPVRAGNDANVAALGEARFGAGSRYQSMVMITLGTGVGGGIILDGKIVPGSHGAAGEIGHLPIWDGAKTPCSCGNTGCLEQIGSATGLVRRARELLEETDLPSTLRSLGSFTAKDVMDRHGQGDAVADAVIAEAVDRLGCGMALVSCVVDPEVFVIGGGVSRAGEWLIRDLEQSFRRQAFHACRETGVVAASLGSEAGLWGAAALVLP